MPTTPIQPASDAPKYRSSPCAGASWSGVLPWCNVMLRPGITGGISGGSARGSLAGGVWAGLARAAVIGLAALSALLIAAGQAAGQAAAQPASAPSALSGAPVVGAVPEPQESMELFSILEGWVRNWEDPENLNETLPKADPEGTTGAAVTLRLHSAVIGRGDAFANDGRAGFAALRAAMLDAQRTLVDYPALHPQVLEDGTVTEPKTIADLAPGMTIELELAGQTVSLLGANYDQATAALSPTLDGVAARQGGRVSAVFPSAMRQWGLAPANALQRATLKLGVPPVELAQLRQQHRVTPMRFRTTHLAQTEPGGPPIFLHRGGRLVERTQLSRQSLMRAADGIAQRLLTHDWPVENPVGMRGAYNPVSDTYSPIIAPPLQQASAAYALSRYAAMPGADQLVAARSKTFVQDILAELAVLTPEEEELGLDPSADPLTAAAVVLAMIEAGEWPGPRPELAALATRCEGAIRDWLQGGASWPGDVPVAAQSIVAYTLARMGRVRGDEENAEQFTSEAAALVRTVLTETPRADLVSAMPWLVMAELELAGDEGDVASAIVLQELRDTLGDFRLSDVETLADDRDLVGGVVFTRGRAPLPSWHTLKPLTMQAVMLGDDRLTPDTDVRAQLAQVMASLRFLMQLTIREGELVICAKPDSARGGVRISTWDQALAIEPQALGLLAITETLHSVAVRSRPKAQHAPEPGQPQPATD